MEKFFYLLANDDIEIKDNDSKFAFSYYPTKSIIRFYIIRSEQDSLNYDFNLKQREDIEVLKKLTNLPTIRKYIEKNYQYQTTLVKEQKRYLESITRILASKHYPHRDKFLIQAAAITAQSFPLDVQNGLLRNGFRILDDIITFNFVKKNGYYQGKMILYKDGETINLTPSLFVDYMYNKKLAYKNSNSRPKDLLNWWYETYEDHVKHMQKNFTEMNKLFLKSQKKSLKSRSRINKNTNKLMEVQEIIKKTNNILPKDFRKDRKRGERGILYNHNITNKKKQPIEIENEK